jgi:hypothetical protein
VRIADQEELELALSRYYGGGTYRFIVKRGQQRMTQGNIRIGGPVKGISPIDLAQPASPTNGAGQPVHIGDSATAAVARDAFQALGNADRTAAEIGLRMMDSASAVVQRLAAPPQYGAVDPSLRELIMELRSQNRGMNLAEIIGAITSVVGIFKELGIIGASSNGGQFASVMERLAGVAVERALNPAPAGAPASPVAEAIHAVTAIAPRAVEGIHEYRLAMEAQRDAIAMQTTRPAQPPQQPPPPQTNGQVLPPAAQPNPNPGAQPVTGLSAELIEQRIVEMLKANVTVNDAAADLFHFLQVGQGPGGVIIPQLVSLGEVGLVNLFSTRDILKPAWKTNSQRCIEFIRAFLKYAAEEGNPAPQGTA